MASVPKRYTYYGGETSILPNSVASKGVNGGNNLHERQRRKHVTFGPYILGSTLGEGEFGKVKLGWSKQSSTSATDVPKQVAVKLIRRDTIPKNSEKEIKVYREINALKHLSHPNIVKLEEVLQNSKYIGIVLEYASGGEFYKYIQRKRRLKESVACRLFAQLTSGVHYMHSKGLVHRDLKLENLLLDKHENLIITDFGFVNEFFQHNELMKTSCGSPCYAAPELVISTKPYEARKADVWSCGIILYAMLAGYLPWDDDPKNPDGNDIAKLYHYITRTPLKFPEYINPLPRDLLRRILVSDPKRRISLRNIQRHEWIKPHLPFLSITPEEWDRTMMSKEVFRPPRLNAQRPTRPRSNCSTSSANSKGEKRDSLIIDSTLVNLPAPPQESQSHVITIPSPPSPELRHSPVRGVNRHSRSNSAASIALQAVVEAEREHNLQHDSYLHLQKIHHPNNNRVSPAFLSQRSNTHSSSVNGSSLMNKDSTIVEASPAKGAKTVPPFNSSSENSSNTILAGSSSNNRSTSFKKRESPDRPYINSSDDLSYHHLTSQHRKPRPTSYHPSSSSSVTGSTDILPMSSTINGGPNHSSGVVEASPFESVPALNPEPKYPSPFDNSPKMLQRKSFSGSKPSLDLQKVSGDLIRAQNDGDAITSKINEEVEDSDHRKRRQSRRFSTIVGENGFSPVTEEIEEPNSIKEEKNVTKPTERSATVKSSDKLALENKNDKKRFSFFSLYSMHNTSKSSLGSNDSKSVVKSPTPRKLSSSSLSASVVPPELPNKAVPVIYKSTKSSREPSAGEQKALEKALNEPANTKESHPIQRQGSYRNPSNRVSSRVTNSSNSSNGNQRQSIMISSLNETQQSNQPQQRHTNDQSTARKVIDFFKRRSMRL